MSLKLHRAVVELGGTTGLALWEKFLTVAEERFGSEVIKAGVWGGWQFLLSETTEEIEAIYDLPCNFHFIAINPPLERLGSQKHHLAEGKFAEVPTDILSKPLGSGGGQVVARVSYGVYLMTHDFNQRREKMWSQINDAEFIDNEFHRLTQRVGGIKRSGAKPFVIIAGHAGGSTFNSVLPHAIDFWAQKADRVLVFLMGPHLGVSHDSYRTESANLVACLLTIQHRVQGGLPIYGFLVDGPAEKRERILMEVADLIFDLLTEDQGSWRNLVNAYEGANRMRNPSEPIRWLCILNFRRVEIPAKEILRLRALEILHESLEGMEKDEVSELPQILNANTVVRLRRIILSDGIINEALSRSGDDVEVAVREGVELVRVALPSLKEEMMAKELTMLRNQLRMKSFAERVSLLQARTQELFEKGMMVEQDEATTRTVKDAEQFYRVALAQSKRYGEVALLQRAKRELIRALIWEGVTPQVAGVLYEAAHAVDELSRLAQNDLATFHQLRQLLESEIERLQNSLVNNPLILAGEDAQLMAFIKQRHIPSILNRHFCLDIGDFSVKDPRQLLEELVEDIANHLPSPKSVASLLSDKELAGFLSNLPINNGLRSDARYLWDLNEPLIIVVKPTELQIPQGIVGAFLTIDSSDKYKMVARVFQVAPIPAISGWEDWARAYKSIQEAYGGPWHLAEPWLHPEHRELLKRFNESVKGVMNHGVEL